MSKEKRFQTIKKQIKSKSKATASKFFKNTKSFDKNLKELLYDVQKNHLYKDDKTFIDLVPRYNTHKIKNEYLLIKDNPNFNLENFINRHFFSYSSSKESHNPTNAINPRLYIKYLWNELERNVSQDEGSLIALPNKYIVPGGRFNEQFYWDSYFIMLGLAADSEWDLLEGMLKNIIYMINEFGFIPTANRTYLLSRSQPPFFSRMVRLLSEQKGESILPSYLPYLLIEYRFWMIGSDTLKSSNKNEFARTVNMPNGVILNRYYDNTIAPRPESLGEDLKITKGMAGPGSDSIYLNIRAAAESGWDFSSRWFDDPMDMHTIQTISIIPVDLNCLLFELEDLIAKIYELINKSIYANKFKKLAELRVSGIQKYCWDSDSGFFFDYNFCKNHSTDRATLASVFPLYSKVATDDQARLVALRLEKDFLKAGGLATTLINTDQQWDGSNGWAPLQWVAIKGLRNYGYTKLADEIKKRWIDNNLKVLSQKNMLIEKYNVDNLNQLGSGGEYQLQIGFGWTNGVLAALLQEDEVLRSSV